jgi:hypothetical protein
MQTCVNVVMKSDTYKTINFLADWANNAFLERSFPLNAVIRKHSFSPELIKLSATKTAGGMAR